jgi:hypothetical protein
MSLQYFGPCHYCHSAAGYSLVEGMEVCPTCRSKGRSEASIGGVAPLQPWPRSNGPDTSKRGPEFETLQKGYASVGRPRGTFWRDLWMRWWRPVEWHAEKERRFFEQARRAMSDARGFYSGRISDEKLAEIKRAMSSVEQDTSRRGPRFVDVER